jgi:hypothetical protein
MILCVRPECQTTAGCKCSTVAERYGSARNVALEADLARLRAENEALRTERDDEKREHEYWALRGIALTKAFKELPEVPPVTVLDLLSDAGNFPEDWERGKAMQRKHRLEAIPPRTEYEIGAGVWSRLLSGFRAEAARAAAEAKAARLETALTAAQRAMNHVFMTCDVPVQGTKRRAWANLMDAIKAADAALEAKP